MGKNEQHRRIPVDQKECQWTPQGALTRRVLKGLLWERVLGQGFPENPRGCDRAERTSYDTSSINTGTTLGCPGCEMRGAHSEECRKRIEQETVDASGVVDTEAVKRPRSPDDPTLGDTVESETKSARLDRDETAKDFFCNDYCGERVVV